MSATDGKVRPSYNDIHSIIGATAPKIAAEFTPDIMVAIGGGGFIPARILRTFLKTSGSKNIPIQAIGLSLYEEIGQSGTEQIGKEVIRTQWLDFSTLGHTKLVGRKILIVDEVDESRTTLAYAINELRKDLKQQLDSMPEEQRAQYPPTEFAVFVVHNKLKEKAEQLPADVKYFAGGETGPEWIEYPWEATDVELHDRLGAESRKLAGQ